MIISKTPLRISFFSGGSDIPAFYEQDWGAALSVTIDKYNYVCLNQPTDDKIRYAYDYVGEVSSVHDVRHKIIKEILLYKGLDRNISINSIADVNGKGSGLGSSSAFTVGLLNAIDYFQCLKADPTRLAETACFIELLKCGFPIGKQDQYAAAFGGFNNIVFSKNGDITVSKPIITKESLDIFQNKLLLVYTGVERDSSEILSQQSKLIMNDVEKIELVKNSRNKISYAIDYVRTQNDRFGELLNRSWQDKKAISGIASTRSIDETYDVGINSGAIGGKLLGAGGGGHLLFYVRPEKRNYVIDALYKYNSNLKMIDFNFVYEGSKVFEI